MTNKEIFKSVLKAEKLTQVQYVEKVGMPSQSYLSGKISRVCTLQTLFDLVEPLGYELVIRKKGVKKPTEYIVEVKEED